MSKKLLILTSHDFLRFSNSRIKHLARHLSGLFEETYVGYRSYALPPSKTARIKAFLTLETRLFEKASLKLLEINPLGARPHGLATRLLKIPNPFEEKLPKLKRFLQEGLSLVGGISDLLILPSLLLALRRLGEASFQVLIAQGPFEVLCGALLKKWGKIGLFICDDADYEPGFAPTRLRRLLLKTVEKTGMKRADLVVSVGELLAERRRKEYGLKEVIVIPNGVEYHLLSQGQKKKNEAFYSLLYMGFIGGWSGLDLLLEALSLLKKRKHPLPRIFLAGHTDDFFFRHWQKRAQEQGLPFSYLGRFSYEELAEPLSCATIGWATFPPIALRRYAFPLKVVEYMAGGLAVIATRDTEAGRLVARHGTGYVIPYEAKSVAQVIQSIYQEPHSFEERRKRTTHVASQYDWRLLLRQYSDLVRKNL